MKRIGRLASNETLVVLADGTIHLATEGQALHGAKILSCLMGSEVTDGYFMSVISPRLAQGAVTSTMPGERKTAAEEASGITIGSDLTIGDEQAVVTDVKDVTAPGDFPTFAVTAEREGGVWDSPEADKLMEGIEADKTKRAFPAFATVNGTALRHEGRGSYFRVAGSWGIKAEWKDGTLIVRPTTGPLKHLSGLPLIECTEEDFKNDNAGYV